MQVESMSELAPVALRIVVINVGTDDTTSLALASARAHGDGAARLLVNCDPTTASRASMVRLADRLGFDIVELPRMVHGDVLDRVFSESRDEFVLLLDSDAELRDPSHVARLRSWLADERFFGAGYVKGPSWAAERVRAPRPGMGLFVEQPWTPCLLLRVADAQEALAAGVSFRAACVPNDVRFSPRLSALLAKRFQNGLFGQSRLVHRLPRRTRERLRASTLPGLRWARGEVHGQRPNWITYDTAAAVYQWCKYERLRFFAGTHVRLRGDEVFHYGGLTSVAADARLGAGARLLVAGEDARQRLRSHYDIDLDLDAHPESGPTASRRGA